MKGINIKLKKRALSILLCALLIAALVLSAAFIILHSHHHCTGADCPICAQIHIAELVLNGFKVIFAVTAVCVMLHAIRCAAVVLSNKNNLCNATLIGLKVKLSD